MDQKNLNHHNDNDDDDDGYDLSCNNDSFVTFNTTNLDELNRIIEESSSLDLPKSLIITNMDSRIFQQSTEQRVCIFFVVVALICLFTNIYLLFVFFLFFN